MATRSNIAGTCCLLWSSRCMPRGPLAILASGLLRISQPPNTARLVPGSREYDVGADREPEGVIADKRYLDEHANDRKDHQHERKHKPKVHCAYLLALRRNAKNLAWSIATGNVRDLVASSKATSEICGPRSMLSHSQSACALACGARLENRDAGLDYECCFLPRTSDSGPCAMSPKRRFDSGIFEGFSWSV